MGTANKLESNIREKQATQIDKTSPISNDQNDIAADIEAKARNFFSANNESRKRSVFFSNNSSSDSKKQEIDDKDVKPVKITTSKLGI